MKLPAFLVPAPAPAAGTQPGQPGAPRAAATDFGARLDSALAAAPSAGPVPPESALPAAVPSGPAVPATAPPGTTLDGPRLSKPWSADTGTDDAAEAVNDVLAAGTMTHFWPAVQNPAGQQLATTMAPLPESVDPAAGAAVVPPAVPVDAPAGTAPAAQPAAAAPAAGTPAHPAMGVPSLGAAPEAMGGTPVQGAAASLPRASTAASTAGRPGALAVDAVGGAPAAAEIPAGEVPRPTPSTPQPTVAGAVPHAPFGAAPAGVRHGLPDAGGTLTPAQVDDGPRLPAPDAQPQPSLAPQQPAAAAPVPPAFPVPAHQPVPAPAVAQPAQPAPPAAAAPLAEQLARPLFSLAGASLGDHVMTINVVPEALGPVTVRAQLSADGIRIEMFPASEAGREGLRHILGDLRRDLAAGGLAASVGMGAGNAGPEHGAGNGHGPRGQQDLATTPGLQERADAPGPAVPDRQPPRAIPAGASTSLDITV